jgi:hypothetical protein
MMYKDNLGMSRCYSCDSFSGVPYTDCKHGEKEMTQITDDKKLALDAYKTGSWYFAQSIDDMSDFYLSRLPAIRQAAKDNGYAIGVHGSTRRDFDLIATPWRDGYSDRDTLAKAIQNAACGIVSNSFSWENKPCGRIATSFPIVWPEFDHYAMKSAGHIDLSISALTAPAAPEWQTIETAPRDGTVIEVCTASPTNCAGIVYYAKNKGGFYVQGFNGVEYKTATHWRHRNHGVFPAAPVADNGGEVG